MRKLFYINVIFCLASAIQVMAADDMASANDAYRAGDYQNAIQSYQQILPKRTSADVYYNLGNAYYRIENIPKALLYYEKAAKLSPMDDDITHNINIARAKTIDKLPPESEVFFVRWYRYLQSVMTIDGWAYMSLGALIIALLLFLGYLFLSNISIRRVAFYSSTVLFTLFVIGNVFALQRKMYLEKHDTAIIMSSAVSVKVSPTLKASDACMIHEGTKVTIIDDDINAWLGIRLSDGREGWIQSKDVEKI